MRFARLRALVASLAVRQTSGIGWLILVAALVWAVVGLVVLLVAGLL